MHRPLPALLLCGVLLASLTARAQATAQAGEGDCVSASPCASSAPASEPLLVAGREPRWDDTARFFTGLRTSVGIPPGGFGVAPSLALELGVSAPTGIGFGLHLMTMGNPPSVPRLGIPKAEWGVGALADVRMYFQSIEPLTLYATLSGGFLAGPDAQTGANVVLPMVNPGFGARVKLTDTMYTAFELGFAGFHIPFLAFSMGWEPERRPRARRAPVASAEAERPASRS